MTGLSWHESTRTRTLVLFFGDVFGAGAAVGDWTDLRRRHVSINRGGRLFLDYPQQCTLAARADVRGWHADLCDGDHHHRGERLEHREGLPDRLVVLLVQRQLRRED